MPPETDACVSYPEIPEDRGGDLVHLERLQQADLVLFMAGNQFMVMPELVRAYQSFCPGAATIFYETLPPGLELRQILAGGARFRGRTYRIQPDVYTSVSRGAMQTLEERGLIDPDDCFVYLHNRLSLMVYRGNPKGVQSVADLGRADIVVSQPDPEHEHIAAHVIAMYEQAGGPSLAARILEEKRAGGTTRLTTVHHRETPQRLIQGDADAGPVWHTEIIEAQGRGLPLEGVEVGADLDQRDAVEYWIAPLKGGQNRENAMKFLEFIASPPARRIFTAHGFAPP